MAVTNEILRDRYKILSEISRGGMGAVYLAQDLLADEPVAIKKSFFSGDHVARIGFESEAKLLARLRHPGLPKVVDYFLTDEGVQVLVMTFISGMTLEEMLSDTSNRNGRGLEPERVEQWTLELLEILRYLHSFEPPVLHRDIKPNNIKITDEGKLFLLDFGLAKGSDMTIVHGRTGFSPLEQVEQSGTDKRSDIYALGASLFHILTDDYPLTAIDRFRLVRRRTENQSPKDPVISEKAADPQRSVREFNPKVSAEFGDIVMKAMALHPEDRFQSAEEMSIAILKYRQGKANDRQKGSETQVDLDPDASFRLGSTSKPSLLRDDEVQMFSTSADKNLTKSHDRLDSDTESRKVETDISNDETIPASPQRVDADPSTEIPETPETENDIRRTNAEEGFELDQSIDPSPEADPRIMNKRNLFRHLDMRSGLLLLVPFALLISAIVVALLISKNSVPSNPVQGSMVVEPSPEVIVTPDTPVSPPEPPITIYLKKSKSAEELTAPEHFVNVGEEFSLSLSTKASGDLYIVSRKSDGTASLYVSPLMDPGFRQIPIGSKFPCGKATIKEKVRANFYFVIVRGDHSEFSKQVAALFRKKETSVDDPGVSGFFDALERNVERTQVSGVLNLSLKEQLVAKVTVSSDD